ncbi:MAG TPA: hypothetical protein PK971_03005, partial [Saprospiraceae bacterium]|nr:hypothetical protein [Saprospiraceae bacterium]
MRRLLILSLVCWCSTASLLYAQVPQQISVEGKVTFTPRLPGQPESLCNSAGTFLIGQPGVTTQSNDLALPVIYLCKGDSIFINHNGDADLSGDPVAGTPPGVAWAIYRNKPTVGGDNLQQIVTPDMLTGTNTLPLLAFGEPEGDIWFRNFCYLQDSFNNSQPVKLFFAPVTVDNFDPKGTWESAQVGFPPGPCVNVNIADAFEVVYLNPITIEAVNTANGNDCVGSFVVKGGLPQYDKDERYTIDIHLSSDPTVKALIYTSVPSYQHGNPINFSVKQPGQYTIVIEDGRSCGFRGTINMAGCNPADNLTVDFPDTIAPPGSTICIPIKVDNFTGL